jgi:hypothetical protein
MKPIAYSQYKEILEIAQRTDVENSYEELMKKESDVLNTVNTVVKYYRDNDIHEAEFIHQSIVHIMYRFSTVWKQVIEEATSVSSYEDLIEIVSKNDRPIYLGISLILLALFLIFIEFSKW